jgi:hypothetical protein
MVDTFTNRETETIAQIERMDLQMRLILKRIEHAGTDADRRALNRQLGDLTAQVNYLRRTLK